MEEEINQYLAVTLKVYFHLKEKGKHDQADKVLALGSAIANDALDITEIRKTYHKGVYCPACKEAFTDPDNIISIQGTGYCLGCNHLYSPHGYE